MGYHLYENAVFLAERVHAESPCDASKLLLATCHYSAGAANRAVVVLQSCATPQNRYLLALCCMRLGRLQEAQNAQIRAEQQARDEKKKASESTSSSLGLSPSGTAPSRKEDSRCQ